MKQINIIKKSLLILITIFSISFLFADEDEVLLIPYSATSLTPEQQAMNPTYVAYPTLLQSSIPRMKCNYEFYGFTIDAQGHKVGFSPGNLQYQASTGTWRFAEHQWDFVGFSDSGNVYENGTKCDNSLIAENYSGWIDLFAWATSGWIRKNGYGEHEYYNPTDTINDQCQLYRYHIQGDGTRSFDIGSGFENADWGIYNQIGADTPNTWRTLSKTQWEFIIDLRSNANNLCGLGKVNGVYGLILLPDEWIPIAGLSFNPSRDNASANDYSVEDWNIMESNGAVFLPCAKGRNGTKPHSNCGKYWSSSARNQGSSASWICYHSYIYTYETAFNIYFDSSSINATHYTYRNYGLSVRLVRNIDN